MLLVHPDGAAEGAERPFTVVNIMCLALNSISVWAGSSIQAVTPPVSGRVS